MVIPHTSRPDPLLAQHARLWAQLDRLLLRRADLSRRAQRTAQQEQEIARIELTVVELRRQSRRISEVLRDEAWAPEHREHVTARPPADRCGSSVRGA